MGEILKGHADSNLGPLDLQSGALAAILAKDTCVTSELETYGLFRFFYLSRKHDQPQVLTNPHLCCDHPFKDCVLITHENLMQYPCSASF